MNNARTLIPSTALISTRGGTIDLSKESGRSVLFVYPRTSPPAGAPTNWQTIPGARGCTAESCSFRDLSRDYEKTGTQIFGLSTQKPEYQLEASERLHLSYPLLSDSDLIMRAALNLPVFEFEGMTLYQRTTLVIESGVIIHQFSDIEDPETHPHDVLSWVRNNSQE